ncbi:hypothetical protein [Stigmatella aurantiaca]|uniref:Conserved uncharacterized protein n=1 Tax=Stigmatella aurantiaca (strain DW4/3-1) TaxID=378806 RepID=Q094Y5_STIAD|nr:hypothetical protein [Stigmatella aurantiaca]ADO71337.1 conserved uncharacterized protein [Stigmatella aurantiaca DW4/3-1]EAU67266.1 hypothetical protein STIAU_4940 [Stigmatella aurantiaca DW4/3-1]
MNDLLMDPALAQELADEAARLPAPPASAQERLRHQLEASQRPPLDTAWPQVLQAPREKQDTRYAEPATSHRPVVGPVLVFAKRSFRRIFQPFINEVMRRQVEFNEALLDSLALIYDEQRENARIQAAWRKDVSERLAQLEQAQPPQRER